MEPKVQAVDVQNERDLTPEMILNGPKARGDVHCYVLVDGKTAYFNAKTGEAIGREFRIKPPRGRVFQVAQGRTNTVVMASRTSQGVDRSYMR
jgi:hypothetical protein